MSESNCPAPAELGADKIYMTRFGTLSPIDPSVTNEFNPHDPASPGDRIPIAVEDVLAFFQLASEQGGDDNVLAGDAFRRLAESVHPLALGNVKRNIEQIWQLAKRLIRLHLPDLDDAELTDLVMRLTTELYSHSHLINRTEARARGLPVEQPPEGVEDRLLAYYDQLKTDLELLEKFDAGARRRAPDLNEYDEGPDLCRAPGRSSGAPVDDVLRVT
jgi:hypothetical protein